MELEVLKVARGINEKAVNNAKFNNNESLYKCRGAWFATGIARNGKAYVATRYILLHKTLEKNKK